MPSYITKNAFLTEEEMTVNAQYIYGYLTAQGWSPTAVCGMLGNMETESTINPGIWQNLNPDNYENGFGLVQWTPARNYIYWCQDNGYEPQSMIGALKRIEYELENGLQYYPTDAYPLTFAEFKVSTLPAGSLAQAFLRNYERPKDQNQPARSTQAEKWYSVLKGSEGGNGGSEGGNGGSDNPVVPYKPRENKPLPLWLILSASRRR